MSKLCQHDWIGDDRCAYCQIEELEEIIQAMECREESTQERIAELETTFERVVKEQKDTIIGYENICKERLNSISELETENASLKDQIKIVQERNVFLTTTRKEIENENSGN